VDAGVIRLASASDQLGEAMGTEEGRAELRKLFETVDKDGDGKVSSTEWGRSVAANGGLMGKYFGGQTMAEVGAAFRRIDANGDGKLTWDEFESATRALGEAAAAAAAAAAAEGGGDTT
jgi:Ca2+-binding EF-hand superfamily protein